MSNRSRHWIGVGTWNSWAETAPRASRDQLQNLLNGIVAAINALPSATLTTSIRLQGVISAVSALPAAVLGPLTGMAGVIPAIANLPTATLTTVVRLAGVIPTVAHPTGALTTVIRVAGSVAGVSNVPAAALTAGAGAQSMYTAGIYVAPMALDSRNNYHVGGAANREVSLRFRASQSSTPIKVAFNQRWGTSGYSGGTTVNLKAAIQADDGTGDPSGTDLMSLTWTATNGGGGTEDRNYLNFSGGSPLVAGNLYHLRVSNVGGSPTVNWRSLNQIYVGDVSAYPFKRQPAFENDLAVLFKNSGGVWKQPGDSGISDPNPQQDTPVFDLVYANGAHDGQGYFGIIDGSQDTVSGTTNMVREKFTVGASSLAITKAAFRVMRTAGSGALTIGVYTSAGTLLASGTVASSNFPLVGAPSGNLTGSRWGVVTFSQITLTSGQTYYIRASCPAGTTYYTAPIQQHEQAVSSNPNWGAPLLVGVTGAGANGMGGGGEATTNGSTWVDVYQFAAADVMAYVAA